MNKCLILLGASLLLVGSAFAADKVTYSDNILPIFRNACLKCHNADERKSDLDLSTFNALLKGSSSGSIVSSGDANGSKLTKVITHAEEPTMPPKGKLPDKEIDTIKQWIAGGLLENSGSKAIVASKPKLNLAVANPMAKPEGPLPMPLKVLPIDPVTYNERTTVSLAMAASPWSPLVAIAAQRQVVLYNTDTLKLAGVIPFKEGSPYDLKFSRNGKLLAIGGGRASKSGFTELWDITTGQQLLTVGDDFDAVLATDISPDQKLIALGGPTRLVKIYSTGSGEILHKMKKHTDWVTAMAFSPDSMLLATGDRNGGVVVWEAEEGQELCTLPGHRARVVDIAWRGTNLVQTASEDGTTQLWNVDDVNSVRNITTHSGGALGMSVSNDGTTVTCGRDKQAVIWDPNGVRKRSFTFLGDIPSKVVVTASGDKVIGSDWNGKIYVWNAVDGKELGQLTQNPPKIAPNLLAAEKRILVHTERLAKDNGEIVKITDELGKANSEMIRLPAESPPTKLLGKKIGELSERMMNIKATNAPIRLALDTAKKDALVWRQQKAYTVYLRANQSLAQRKSSLDNLLAEIAAAELAAKKAGDDHAATLKTDLAKIKTERQAAADKARQLLADKQKELTVAQDEVNKLSATWQAAQKTAAIAEIPVAVQRLEIDKYKAARTGLDATAAGRWKLVTNSLAVHGKLAQEKHKPAQDQVIAVDKVISELTAKLAAVETNRVAAIQAEKAAQLQSQSATAASSAAKAASDAANSDSKKTPEEKTKLVLAAADSGKLALDAAAKLKVATVQLQALEAELPTLNKSIAAQKKIKTGLDQSAAAVMKEIQIAVAQITKAQAEHTAATNSVAVSQLHFDKLNAELAKLQTNIAASIKPVTDAKAAVDKATAEKLKPATQLVADATKSFKDAEGAVKAVESEQAKKLGSFRERQQQELAKSRTVKSSSDKLAKEIAVEQQQVDKLKAANDKFEPPVPPAPPATPVAPPAAPVKPI